MLSSLFFLLLLSLLLSLIFHTLIISLSFKAQPCHIAVAFVFLEIVGAAVVGRRAEDVERYDVLHSGGAGRTRPSGLTRERQEHEDVRDVPDGQPG